MTRSDPLRRVLVIEDEDNIALALQYLIERDGHAYDRIATGATALAHIRATNPDLVLLDVMLPEVSGYEICAQARLDPELAGLKILIMTARGSVMERRKSMALGADGFISKPFDPKDLRSEVRRLLDAGA